MKFETNNGETEKKVTLIIRTTGGKIELIGRDSAGTQKRLMEFSEGKFSKSRDAQLEGLDTDEEGKIMEFEEE